MARAVIRVQGTGKAMRLAQTLIGLGAMASMLVLAGCRQDMQDEPKFFPQRGTTFYPDGRSVRPQVANTVARNQGDEDAYFYTGIVNGEEGDGLPIPLTADTMARGQERYNIYCAPCHSRVGNGNGMIVQRGYRPAGNFNTDRLRHAPLGHYFAVITHGYGSMPDYAAQIAPQDRWAIAAYIRALELSQDATAVDLPAGQHVEDLHQIAHDQGMLPGFADPWAMPATAVYGTPDGKDHGIPGRHITTAMDPATLDNILTHGSKASTADLGRSTTPGPSLAQPGAKNPGKTAEPKQSGSKQ